MAIDGVDVAGMADTVRRLQQETEIQENQDATQKDSALVEQERSKQSASTGSEHSNPEGQRIEGRRPEDAVQELDKTGAELHEESVETASVQQDRGEQWQQFSASPEERDIPPSVEDQANEAQDSAERDEPTSVNVAELMKQMAIDSGKISS